jgi:hypothetical protein
MDEAGCRFHAQVTSDDFHLTFSTWSEEPTTIKRMLACTLLCAFPPPMLDEAVRGLRDQFEFYAEDLACAPAVSELVISAGHIVDPDDSMAPTALSAH